MGAKSETRVGTMSIIHRFQPRQHFDEGKERDGGCSLGFGLPRVVTSRILNYVCGIFDTSATWHCVQIYGAVRKSGPDLLVLIFLDKTRKTGGLTEALEGVVWPLRLFRSPRFKNIQYLLTVSTSCPMITCSLFLMCWFHVRNPVVSVMSWDGGGHRRPKNEQQKEDHEDEEEEDDNREQIEVSC